MKNFLTFIGLLLLIFLGSFFTLDVFGLVPDEIRDIHQGVKEFLVSFGQPATLGIAEPVSSLLFPNQPYASVNVGSTSTTTGGFYIPEKPFSQDILPAVNPTRIIIEKIGVSSSVQNPTSSENAILDQELLKGVVHYPGSGSLRDDSNLFLFGHSTTYRTVNNRAYKAFNDLNKLNLGDHIRVQSDNQEFLYVVTLVSQVDKNDALIEFTRGEKKLTLSTCDTFGKKSDRFVVEARFVTSYDIPDLSR